MKTKVTHPKKPLDFETLRAADVMQRDVVTVRVSDSLEEVERVLADAKVGGVPVLDENERILGVLSTTDLVDRYAGDEDDQDARTYVGEDDEGEDEYVEGGEANGLCAGDVMTPEIESVSPEASLREVATVMATRRIHRVLVVQRERLVGIVTTLDVMRAIADAR